jgi:hypothetical protein
MVAQQRRASEPTVDVVLVEVHQAKAAATAQIAALDIKAGLVLTSATFLATVAGGLQAAVAASHVARHVLLTLPGPLGAGDVRLLRVWQSGGRCLTAGTDPRHGDAQQARAVRPTPRVARQQPGAPGR